MPKRVKKAVRDSNQIAYDVVRLATNDDTTSPIAPAPTAEIRKYMKALGKRGGKVSGARRMTNLNASQRKEIARKAAAARWAKSRSK